MSLITANQQIGKESALFFRNMALSNLNGHYESLWVAPTEFKNNLFVAIDEEIEKAKKRQKARIIFKMNALTDKETIEKLIEASKANVKIDLIVRGICCLIPRVFNQTDNINVISIVGRFLEHSRIYCFGEDETARIYISSADLMTRNTERRVEIACPILDASIKNRITESLNIMLKDNENTWEMNGEANYEKRIHSEFFSLNCQDYFIQNEDYKEIKNVNEQKRNNWFFDFLEKQYHFILQRLKGKNKE